MPIPDFVRDLRDRVGHDLLPLVGVTGVVRNAAGEILLARRTDTGEWAPPAESSSLRAAGPRHAARDP